MTLDVCRVLVLISRYVRGEEDHALQAILSDDEVDIIDGVRLVIKDGWPWSYCSPRQRPLRCLNFDWKRWRFYTYTIDWVDKEEEDTGCGGYMRRLGLRQHGRSWRRISSSISSSSIEFDFFFSHTLAHLATCMEEGHKRHEESYQVGFVLVAFWSDSRSKHYNIVSVINTGTIYLCIKLGGAHYILNPIRNQYHTYDKGLEYIRKETRIRK